MSSVGSVRFSGAALRVLGPAPLAACAMPCGRLASTFRLGVWPNSSPHGSATEESVAYANSAANFETESGWR